MRWRLLCASIVFFSCCFLGTAPTWAATEEEIQTAIDDGLAWLASTQNPNGSWGSGEWVATTGLALVNLQERAFELGYSSPFDPGYLYSQNVIDGLNYLLSRGVEYTLNPQIAGNPDSNGDGVGIGIYDSLHYSNYSTGIALMAIVASRAPTRAVTAGPLTGQTYGVVAQNMVDWLAWAQTDPACQYRGGWNYDYANNVCYRSDNSFSGYVVLGLRYAEAPAFGFTSTIPPFVKSELNLWIDYIQSPDGGSGYSSPGNWENLLKTGNLLVQMSFVGDTTATQRVQDAVAYIQNHWNDPGGCGTGWNPPTHLQAMYNLMKGLESLDIDTITVGGEEIDWFLDPDQFADVLVNSQLGDGSWPRDCWERWNPYVLSSGWALLTLQRLAPPPPVEVAITLAECVCDVDSYDVVVDYTVERFSVDGTLTFYNDGGLVYTLNLNDFTGSDTFTWTVVSDSVGLHEWEAVLEVVPVGGGTPGEADDAATITVQQTPEVSGIEDQVYPFDTFDLDAYLVVDPGNVVWSFEGNTCLGVSIDPDNVVTVTNPGLACTDPEDITFWAAVEYCDGGLSCEAADTATYTPNQPPDCSGASAGPDRVWPPNHKFVPVSIMDVTDPDGDVLVLTVDSIFQDEPVETAGDGSFEPDGMGVGTETAAVRAERSGTKKVPGDGRVYHVTFTADDGRGGLCSATVNVCVPHSVEDTCVDQGPLYDSTGLEP